MYLALSVELGAEGGGSARYGTGKFIYRSSISIIAFARLLDEVEAVPPAATRRRLLARRIDTLWLLKLECSN